VDLQRLVVALERVVEITALAVGMRELVPGVGVAGLARNVGVEPRDRLVPLLCLHRLHAGLEIRVGIDARAVDGTLAASASASASAPTASTASTAAASGRDGGRGRQRQGEKDNRQQMASQMTRHDSSP